MNIRHLTVRDFGGIELVEADLDPGLNLLNGENGSGKSSLIHALRACTHGAKGMPEDPIREGAVKAQVIATLSDGYTVEVSQTDGGTFTLRVKTPEGHIVQRPQEVLRQPDRHREQHCGDAGERRQPEHHAPVEPGSAVSHRS